MTIFSKLRDSQNPEPARCERCRARPGTAHLHLLRPPEQRQAGGAAGMWLCARCRDEVRRGSAGN